MRGMARLVSVCLALSLLGPVLLCGGGIVTAKEASDCCRAMHLACHKRDGSSACCNQRASAPQPLAVVTTSRGLAGPQPVFRDACLPALHTPTLLGAAARPFAFSGTHSPPRELPIFLLHSSLRI